MTDDNSILVCMLLNILSDKYVRMYVLIDTVI